MDAFLPRTHHLRLAVVGVGIAGQSHLLDAVTVSDIDVIALCSRQQENAERVAHNFGIPFAYSNLEHMLREQSLDAVIIATPPHVQAVQAALCLHAHLDVLVEKPFAARQHHVREVARALSDSGRFLRVAYTRRYKTAWRQARQWIATGQIGALMTINCSWCGPYRQRYSAVASTYRADPVQRIAGVVLDSGCHALDAILYLTGEVGNVCSVNLEFDEHNQADIAGMVTMTQSTNTTVTLHFQDGAHKEIQSVALEGTGGTIVIDNDGATLQRKNGATEHIADHYDRRPVDDLLAHHNGQTTYGASFVEASQTIQCVREIYRFSARPLQPPWRKPRAKALARLSGAC